MSDCEHDQGIVTTRVVIERKYHPSDGVDTVRVDTEGEPTLIELLGLLDMARMDAIAPAILSTDDETEW